MAQKATARSAPSSTEGVPACRVCLCVCAGVLMCVLCVRVYVCTCVCAHSAGVERAKGEGRGAPFA